MENIEIPGFCLKILLKHMIFASTKQNLKLTKFPKIFFKSFGKKINSLKDSLEN